MKTKSCQVAEPLEKLRETMTKFTLEGSKTNRSEDDKIEYLHEAVVEAEWACSVLTKYCTNVPPRNFQQLFTTLDAASLASTTDNSE